MNKKRLDEVLRIVEIVINEDDTRLCELLANFFTTRYENNLHLDKILEEDLALKDSDYPLTTDIVDFTKKFSTWGGINKPPYQATPEVDLNGRVITETYKNNLEYPKSIETNN